MLYVVCMCPNPLCVRTHYVSEPTQDITLVTSKMPPVKPPRALVRGPWRWTCRHCGLDTTRGGQRTHEPACPQAPVACAASADGCGWAGLARERAAHEATCVWAAVKGQMGAALRALQAEVAPLRERVAELEAGDAVSRETIRRHEEVIGRNDAGWIRNRDLLRQLEASDKKNTALLQRLEARVGGTVGDHRMPTAPPVRTAVAAPLPPLLSPISAANRAYATITAAAAARATAAAAAAAAAGPPPPAVTSFNDRVLGIFNSSPLGAREQGMSLHAVVTQHELARGGHAARRCLLRL